MIPIYIVSYKNPGRRERMISRFTSLRMENMVTFTSEVERDDPRLLIQPEKNRRVYAIMLQHLDSLRLFLESSHEYCIVCEDDVHISNMFAEKFPTILHDFKTMNLDIMMLGYILTFEIDMDTEYHKGYFPYINNEEDRIYMNSHTYHSYPNDIWGSQMYLVSRSYAKYLLDNYDLNEMNIETINSVNYNPDWIITKNGKRALIYPMVALEEKNDDEQNYDYNKQFITHHNKMFL